MSWETFAAALRSTPNEPADSRPEQHGADVIRLAQNQRPRRTRQIRGRPHDPGCGTGTLQNPLARLCSGRGSIVDRPGNGTDLTDRRR
jgi:hypothetical protein